MNEAWTIAGVLDRHLSTPTKMGRGDDADLADVRAMLVLERAFAGRVITAGELGAAARTAYVSGEYRDIFPQARDKIIAVAAEVGTA